MPHRTLMDKLKVINLNPLLLRWIQSYLSGRSQQVLVNGEKSDPLPVLSGVPQGSIIGPLLFLIYIEGIKTTSLSGESHLTLYADDMLLYRPITSMADYALLQQDIDNISNWVDKNYLQFNVQKCKFMYITRKTKCSQPASHLTLYGQPLKKVNTYKHLGLLLSSDLSWTQHISSICTKAKKLLCLIYRRFINSLLLQRRLYLNLFTMFRIINGLFYFPNDVFVHQTSSIITHSSSLVP